jgi:carboxyl-terminal processing protease
MEKQPKNNGLRKFIIFALAIILIFFVFVSGFFLGVWRGTGAKLDLSLNNIISQAPNYLSDSQNQTDLFWKVWQSIQSKYVGRPADQKTLFYGAVKGLVESLNDPYSVFMDPTMTADFTNELSGEFEGIGA